MRVKKEIPVKQQEITRQVTRSLTRTDITQLTATTIKTEKDDDTKYMLNKQPDPVIAESTLVKKEIEMADVKSLLKSARAKPSFYCEICNKLCPDSLDYHVHELTFVQTSIEAPIPNKDDSNNYCCCCEKHFCNKSSYFSHLRKIHKMHVELPNNTRKNPSIVPDINDPNCYCRSCNFTYKSRGAYRCHIRRVHKLEMTLEHTGPVYDPHMEPDTHKPNSCTICKLVYRTRELYTNHMRRHTRIGQKAIRGKSKINTSVVPDVNDPNLYCKSCKSTYSRRKSYREHLRNIHQMDLSKPNIEP